MHNFEIVQHENGRYGVKYNCEPIVNEFGAFLPSIWDASETSALWFIENGQYESAKYVIRNLADSEKDAIREMLATNHENAEIRQTVREIQDDLIKQRMTNRDLYKSLSISESNCEKQDRVITEMMDELYDEKNNAAYWHDLYRDEVKRSRDLFKRYESEKVYGDVIGDMNGKRFKENEGLRKSYGKVKRAMLALKRKVKDLSALVLSQQAEIEALRERIEDLERDNSEINEINANAYTAAMKRSGFYVGDEW